MDGFTAASIDDVVELWVLSDKYQFEGLKWYCMGSLAMCEESDVTRILTVAEDMSSCPSCEELKKNSLRFLQ